MAFKDKYPVTIEFEIDREKLLRYYRFVALWGCFLPLIMPSLLIVALVKEFLVGSGALGPLGIVCFLAATMLVAFLASAFLYWSYFRRTAAWLVDCQRLLVEGPYLRFVRGGIVTQDTRYHFRDIHSYGTIQGPIQRRFGLKTLTFHLKDHKPEFGCVHVEGVVDADHVRDMLCEIDAAREEEGRS